MLFFNKWQTRAKWSLLSELFTVHRYVVRHQLENTPHQIRKQNTLLHHLEKHIAPSEEKKIAPSEEKHIVLSEEKPYLLYPTIASKD